MTNTYNTLNPLGSTSAKDLSDNTSNFDEGMNSLSPSFYDRFMRRRETWAGMEKMVSDFLEAMGFEATHLVYVDGTPLTVLRPTQLVERAPSVYKVKQPASFPVNLTGTWATDQFLLVDVGDSSLRQDLANYLQGANLTAYKSGKTVRQQFDQMTVARIDLVSSFGLIEGDINNSAKIQQAFDTAPIGSTLVFPSSWTISTTTPLVMSRLMNLELGRCVLRGDFSGADVSSDVLRVAITDTGGGGDVRSMVIRGGSIFNNGGGNCAINVNPAGVVGLLPHFQLLICEGNHAGSTRCIRIGAANPAGDTNFCTIRDNNLGCISTAADSVVDLDNCADGHRIIYNLLYGTGTGVRVNLELGAYQTLIQGNGMVSRDGAMKITNGARVMFLNNQCEQPMTGNTLVPKCSVLIQGLDYVSHGCLISGNNFGGGANVDFNIVLYNTQGTLIDNNYFNPATINDVLFGSSGSLSAKYNTLGGNNWPRGSRSIKSAPTDVTRRLGVDIQAGADGNRGVWRNDVTYSSGWGSVGFEFLMDGYNVVHFDGAVDGGTTTTGTLIAALPTGYFPKNDCYFPFVTETGTFGAFSVGSNGQIVAISVPASPNQHIKTGNVSYSAVFPVSYDVGA